MHLYRKKKKEIEQRTVRKKNSSGNANLFEEHRTYVGVVVATLRADHYSTLYIVGYSCTKDRNANTSYSLNMRNYPFTSVKMYMHDVIEE